MTTNFGVRSGDGLALNGGEPIRSSFLPFHRPSIEADDEAGVLETLRSGWLTKGPKTKKFEEEFADYVRASRCVGVNSCTAALHLALEAIGVGPGDEVVTTPITFASTANAIVQRGATPVFADIDPNTLNIDAAHIEDVVTPKTKAIIPVDFAGQPCSLEDIASVARRHNLIVVEDAAHAVGAEYHGRPIGGISDITCFSFYATKNITSGEGGALTTNDSKWADRVAMMSLHGISRDAWKRYGPNGYHHWEVLCPGYKFNMFDIQASMLLTQLAKLERFLKRRQELTMQLDAAFVDLPEIVRPVVLPEVKHAYHLYPIVIQIEKLVRDCNRDVVMNAIQAENIGVGVHFRAIHLQPYYQERWGFRRGMFPNAEHYSDRAISLPLFPAMTEQDVDDVVRVVRKVITYFRK